MGNVLKYEIKRSRFMMLIVGIIVGCLELAYLIGFFGVKTAQNENFQQYLGFLYCSARDCCLLFHAGRCIIQCLTLQQ